MTAANKANGMRAASGGSAVSAVRARAANRRFARCRTAGIEVRAIKDVTPIPHNGCRPPKKRRV